MEKNKVTLSWVEDLVPVENFLGLKESTEYIIVRNGIDIGILEAHITTSEIYIFNVMLEAEFQKQGIFRKWLSEQGKKVIALWPKEDVKKYWSEVADEMIF